MRCLAPRPRPVVPLLAPLAALTLALAAALAPSWAAEVSPASPRAGAKAPTDETGGEDPASHERARELVERAAEAFGAEALDSMSALRLRQNARVHDPEVEGERQQIVTYRFPDHLLVEMPGPRGTVSYVLTPGDAFMLHSGHPGAVRDLAAEQREGIESGLRELPLVLLRQRHEADFRARLAGSDRVGSTPVELVEVEREGRDSTLAIDPESGRVLQARDVLDLGEGVQDLAVTYSDFRTVDGLTYPFFSESTLDGRTMMTFSLQQLKVDPELEGDLFVRPSP